MDGDVARLKVHATLSRRLVAEVETSDPHELVRSFQPRGAFALLTPNGGGGFLELGVEGVRWRPSWVAKRAGYPDVEVLWEHVVGVRIVGMLGDHHGQASSVVMIRTLRGRLDFVIENLDVKRLGKGLAGFLDSGGPDYQGPMRFA